MAIRDLVDFLSGLQGWPQATGHRPQAVAPAHGCLKETELSVPGFLREAKNPHFYMKPFNHWKVTEFLT